MSRKKHVIYEVGVYRPPEWLKKTVTFRTRKAAEEYVQTLPTAQYAGPRKREVS